LNRRSRFVLGSMIEPGYTRTRRNAVHAVVTHPRGNFFESLRTLKPVAIRFKVRSRYRCPWGKRKRLMTLWRRLLNAKQ
jgi:hypothetical protein